MFWALTTACQIAVEVSQTPLEPKEYEKLTALKIISVPMLNKTLLK